MDDEAVTVQPEDVQVAAIALQIGPDLLVEQQRDRVEAVLVVLAQVGERRMRRDHRSGRLIACRRRGTQRNGDLSCQLFPVGVAVLGDGKPAIDIENIGDVLDREQRPRQLVAFSLSVEREMPSRLRARRSDRPRLQANATCPRRACGLTTFDD